jgi:hypothetical protein
LEQQATDSKPATSESQTQPLAADMIRVTLQTADNSTATFDSFINGTIVPSTVQVTSGNSNDDNGNATETNPLFAQLLLFLVQP